MIRPWHPSPRPPQIHPRHLPRRAFYTAPRTRPWRAGRVVCRLGARARPRGVGTLAGEVRAWGTSFLMIKGDLRASVRKTGGSSYSGLGNDLASISASGTVQARYSRDAFGSLLSLQEGGGPAASKIVVYENEATLRSGAI